MVPRLPGLGLLEWWCLDPRRVTLPKRCPAEFRHRVLALLAEGRSVAEVAHDLQLGQSTIYNWRRQDEIDTGQRPGLCTTEGAELAAARRELAKFADGEPDPAPGHRAVKEHAGPKGGSRRSP
jgi:transposase-like protein